GQGLHRTTARFDSLQFALGKESDRPIVRRPERHRRAISAGQWLRRQAIQVSNPKEDLSRRIPYSERQSAGIGRNASRVVGSRCATTRIKRAFFRRGNDKTNALGFLQKT